MLFPFILAPAVTSDAIAGVESVQLSAVQVFAIAEQLARSGKTDQAIAILQVVMQDRSSDVRTEARVRIARLLAARGDLAGAAVWYRKLLDEKPEASAARMELARTLAEMGDLGGARRELRQAQANGLPADVALLVKQYVAALRSLKPWGGSLEVSIAPDSNINRATSSATLDTIIAPLNLSGEARQKSGVGLRESSQTYARLNVGRSWTLVPRVSSQATLYRASAFNDISGSAQLGLEWRLKADRITPSAGYTWRWFGGNLYARTESVSIDWLHPVGRKAQLDISASVNGVRYLSNPLQSGTIYAGTVSYERALTARSGFNLTLSGNRQTAADLGYATASGGLGGVYWHDFGKMTLFATFNGSRLEADARLWLFPIRRTDSYLRAGGGAVWRKIEVAGFSPVVRIAYERNRSTVGIYDFHRISTDFGITRSF